MTKVKYVMIILFVGMLLLFIPNISKAATRYTYSDTEQNIEWSYELDGSDNVINLRCETESVTGKVTIPSKIEDKTVISLNGETEVSFAKWDYGTFRNCAGLTDVVIPETITTIGEDAFQNCTGLKSVTIPNSVTKIETKAFNGCSGMTSITLSQKLTSIGSSAFSECTGLKSVTIPDSVTTIGEYAFKNCSGMTEVNLPKNLTKINKGTFYGCKGLRTVVLPDNVTTISADYWDGAFAQCSNLQKILIPDTVATIDKEAFYGCSKLTIYGNDGMTSKQYAEENEIPFDYIANWDKADSGADVTAPTVESIEVTYKSVEKYDKDTNKNMYMVPTDAKLVINVTFSEVIEGTKAPTLTIKFGDGQNIQLTEGTIGSSTVIYTYTVKSTDKGVMRAVDYQGGDLKDAAGNLATLSCPALTIQYYSSGHFVYANGTATNPDDKNNNSGTTNNENKNDGNNKGEGANNGSTNQGNNKAPSKPENDETTAKDVLPYAGQSFVLGFALILIMVAASFTYIKVKKYKDIN